jgi:hypothetical protein
MKRVEMIPLSNTVCISGYCMIKRDGVIEIWGYVTDRFERTEPTWKAAYDWALDHSKLPRRRKKLWPGQFYGEDAPASYTEQDERKRRSRKGPGAVR